jgi:hypothetical protein
LVDHCKEKHPKIDPTRCAFVYAHMKPWEEYDQYLSLIHHESLPEDANDYSDYYLNENPDGYYEVDGVLYNDAEHYEFSKNNKEILEYNQKRKYEDKLKAD